MQLPVRMRRDEELESAIVLKYAVVAPVLNERSRRLWAATESLALGYGGDSLVSAATGLARETIRKTVGMRSNGASLPLSGCDVQVLGGRGSSRHSLEWRRRWSGW